MNKTLRGIFSGALCACVLFSASACKKTEPTVDEPLVLDVTATADEDENNIIAGEKHTDAYGAAIAPTAKTIKTARALKVYRKAADKVKADCPGFKRTQWQDFNDITTGEPTGIASRVLTIVSKNVVVNNSQTEAAANPESVSQGDAAAVAEKFPLFRSAYAYNETDNTDFITGAEYVKGDGYKEYYLFFAPELNPVSGGNGLGSLMTPFDRIKILDAIKNYVWNVKTDTLKLDCTYSGCYMMFRVNSRDELIYLEQHMYAQIDAEAEMDLIITSTEFLHGKCRYEEHYTFYDFAY